MTKGGKTPAVSTDWSGVDTPLVSDDPAVPAADALVDSESVNVNSHGKMENKVSGGRVLFIARLLTSCGKLLYRDGFRCCISKVLDQTSVEDGVIDPVGGEHYEPTFAAHILPHSLAAFEPVSDCLELEHNPGLNSWHATGDTLCPNLGNNGSMGPISYSKPLHRREHQRYS